MNGDDRFELRWPGKGLALPAGPASALVVLERFPADDGSAPNLLVAGDNLAVLPALLERARGRAAICYLDPPFVTGDRFRVRRRSGRAGDPDDGGHAFADHSAGGLGAFLAMLEPRLRLARELLAPSGCLYLHLDARTVHAAKLCCDEVFGARRFRNHLVWVYSGRERARTRYAAKHDDILYYARGLHPTFRPERAWEPLRETSRRALSRHVDEDGRAYVVRRRVGGGFATTEEEGATYRQLVPDGIVPRDWFTLDYARKSERTGYPTQKPEALLARLIAVSSDPGDLVVDLFAGSGTSAVAAAAGGRRWIACDASPSAISVTRARLLRQSNAAGGFELAGLSGPEAPAAAYDLAGRIEAAGDGWLVRLEGGAYDLARVDAWAAGRTGAGGTFVAVPGAWASRDPWTQRLSPTVPVAAAGAADQPPLEVRAWDRSGARTSVPLEPMPAR